MKKGFMLFTLLLMLMLVIAGCSQASTQDPTSSESPGDADSQETIVYKLGHIANPDTAYDNFAHEFARIINEESNGRYEIEIYASGTLGVDRELMESLQVGNVQFSVITASDINQFVEEMAVQDLPYLFRDWDHVEKFLDSDAAKDFFSLTDSVRMTTLAFMPRGFRHVTSNVEPIYTPDDLKNLKIRVAESEIYIDTFKALGANAQAMAWSEVYTALQQGTIDAHENTIVTTRDYNIDDVQKYMSETGHFFAFAALQMNTDLLEGMSAEDQEMFRAAGLEAGKKLGLEQKNDEASAKAELEDAGMIFNEVEDKQAFAEMMGPVYDKFFETHDDYYFNLIQNIE